MGALAVAYHPDVPAKPELVTVEEAAAAIGVHPGTVWRYLERKLLARYRSRGAGRPRTMVDMRELRQLLEHPPAERVDE